jgi:predicted N-acetyltransferase YhbS
MTVLDHLAVHPDHKGQGIASMLVNSGINAAQQLSWDSNIFVQAKKTALGVYQTAGFVLIDQLIQDDSAFGGNGEYAAYFLVKEIKRNSAL